MLQRNHPDRIQITFDDRRLVANAGLILPATLALRLGLPELVQQRLDLGNAPLYCFSPVVRKSHTCSFKKEATSLPARRQLKTYNYNKGFPPDSSRLGKVFPLDGLHIRSASRRRLDPWCPRHDPRTPCYRCFAGVRGLVVSYQASPNPANKELSVRATVSNHCICWGGKTMPIISQADATTEVGYPGVERAVLVDATQGALSLYISHLEIGPGGRVTTHIHPDSEEAMVIVEGSLEAILGDQVVTLGEGDTVLAPAGVKHGFENRSGATARLLAIFPKTQFERVPME